MSFGKLIVNHCWYLEPYLLEHLHYYMYVYLNMEQELIEKASFPHQILSQPAYEPTLLRISCLLDLKCDLKQVFHHDNSDLSNLVS